VKRLPLCSSVLALLLSACGANPQQLPVDVSGCHASPRAQSFSVVARIDSKANRPISRLDMTATFYQDFRYRTYAGYAKLAQELDPGQHRDVTFEISNAGRATLSGQALRCFVTRIGYLDGTSESARGQPF
jgi:hypothetical protein